MSTPRSDIDRRPSLLWPLLLIGLGVLLLLQNLNLLPPGTWAALAELWPVLLILLGLDMLVGRRSTGGAILVLLLGIVIVVASLTWAALRASAATSGEPQAIVQTLKEAERAAVEIDFAAGELNVSALADSDHLMEGRLVHATGESLRQSYSVVEGRGELSLSQKHNTLLTPFQAAGPGQPRWEIRLNRSVPLSLAVDTGVGNTALDLTGLLVSDLDLNLGVGQTTVIFPADGALRASVEAGVGSVSLTIPEGMPARITVDSGLTNLQVDPRFGREGGVYTTSGFSTEGDYLELLVEAGLGQITIQ